MDLMALRRSLLMMPTAVPGGLPDEYLRVEYIRAIPGTYINSGYVPTVAPRIETKIQIMNNSDSDLFGFEKMIFPVFIVDAVNYGVAWYNRWGQTNSTWFSTQVKTPTDCVFGKTTVIGTREYPDAFGDTDWSSNAQVMYIGKGRNDTCDVSIYSCKLYDGTAIVRDMIPCIRISDSKPGMYDLVGRQFYTNSGTGEFDYLYPVGTNVYDGLLFQKNVTVDRTTGKVTSGDMAVSDFIQVSEAFEYTRSYRLYYVYNYDAQKNYLGYQNGVNNLDTSVINSFIQGTKFIRTMVHPIYVSADGLIGQDGCKLVRTA